MNVRIKDIALEAGVSPTTVSNVIHGNTKKVSPATIKKIEELLNKRQYIPSMGAKMLAGSTSHLIGILIGSAGEKERSIAEDPFTTVLLSTLEQELFRRHYYTLFHLSDTPDDNWKLAATWDAEGLITIGLNFSENLKIRKQCHVPIVTIDVYSCDMDSSKAPAFQREMTDIGNIGLQDYEGGHLMASHLLAKGYPDFLFLSDNDLGVDHVRWLGIQKALKEKGLDSSQNRHLLLPRDRRQRLEFYCRNTTFFLQSGALFFASDYYACEALNYLSSQGISIPHELGIAGFDDSIYASMCHPALTTIHQDVPAKGKAAVEKLLTLIGGETGILMNERLPVTLVERESIY